MKEQLGEDFILASNLLFTAFMSVKIYKEVLTQNSRLLARTAPLKLTFFH